MKTVFRSSFTRVLKKIKDRAVLRQVGEAIEEVENGQELQEIGRLKKMNGGGNYYRIRVRDYRIGIAVEAGEVEFVRCLHRRDIYRFFP